MFRLLGKIFSRKEKPPDEETPKSRALSKIVMIWDYVPISMILPKLTLMLIKKVPLALIVRVGLNHPYLFLAGIFFGKLGYFLDPVGVFLRILFL